MNHVAATLLALSFVSTATAQLAGPGLAWSGTSGGFARSFLPSCTTLPVAAAAGETVAITVWGDQQAPFALLFALGTGPCMPFPGLGGGLLLTPPVATVGFGLLTQTTPCLACPPGLETLSFPLPAWLPPGTRLAFQAASFGAGHPSFTVAIVGTT